MIGVVTCGGLSTRMGKDKGLLLYKGKTWAELGKNRFAELGMPSIISVNASQKNVYLKYFSETDLVIDNPSINIQGPLLGLLSVHLAYPNENIMVAACDMIKMEVKILNKLNEDFNRKRPSVMAFKGDYVEPMCAVYSSHALNSIFSECMSVGNASSKLIHWLEKLHADFIPIPPEWKSNFNNFNSVDDLAEL